MVFGGQLLCLFTTSTSPYIRRRLGPGDRQTSAVLTKYTLHLPRVCAVLSPVTPNRESSSTPPPKSLPINQSQVPAVEPRVVLLSLKIVSSLSDESQPRLSVSTEKKKREQQLRPAHCCHSLTANPSCGREPLSPALARPATYLLRSPSLSLPSLSLSFFRPA